MDQEADYAIPGIFLDQQNRFVLAAFSEDTVGVYVTRLPHLPTKEEVQRLCERGLWVVLRRKSADAITIFDPDYDGTYYKFTTPDEKESVLIAKQLALGVWPEWCPHLRDSIRPRIDLMILTKTIPEF